MCGFVAYVCLDGAPIDRDRVARMTELVSHRGPDDVGYFFENRIGLGFRRLSILDLAQSGHQPMVSRDGRHVIVFNGEIFNYVELRNELESLGHQFASSGDTEVLLNAYRQWGADCLRRLNGMWAFVIYDRTSGCVFGARDRFGVKPLYVYRDSRRIVLASEIKSLRDSGLTKLDVNWTTAAAFLVEGRLDHSPATFYRAVDPIRAGTAFEIGADGSWKQWRYWNLDEAAGALEMPARPDEAFAELFESAVALRLRSDVSVGVLLSGGLDSTSIICSMARQLGGSDRLGAYCYSAEEFDETPFIAATIEQTGAQLRLLDISPLDAWNSIGDHLWYQDEPVHSFSSVVGFQLMKLARASGATVLLNGQGADEVLGGYPSYYHNHVFDLIRALDWKKARTAIGDFSSVQKTAAMTIARRGLRSVAGEVLQQFDWYSSAANRARRRVAAERSWLSRDLFPLLDESSAEQPANLDGALKYSVETDSLPLYLRVEDRNSMAHATEVRLPFLDYRLVSLAFRLGAEWKLRDGVGKFVLRESMRGRIPEVVRSRTVKFGFPTPADRWFREDLYGPMKDLLAGQAVREAGIWNVALVERELERHRRGEIAVGNRLFDVAQFSMWLGAQPEWEAKSRG
jgi:asparagine synthase (glutamine-hydrolysing)